MCYTKGRERLMKSFFKEKITGVKFVRKKCFLLKKLFVNS